MPLVERAVRDFPQNHGRCFVLGCVYETRRGEEGCLVRLVRAPGWDWGAAGLGSPRAASKTKGSAPPKCYAY